jgi:hypothetical protein
MNATKLGYLLAVLVSGAAMAASQPLVVSLYGIELGKPLPIDKCNINSIGAAEPKLTSLCYRESTDFLPPTDPKQLRDVYVYFPLGKVPSQIDASYFHVGVADGLVEQIMILTKGVDVQQEMLNQLTTKFGPGQVQRSQVQNRFGAQFEITRATWSIGGAAVEFSGANGRVDSGGIYAVTRKGERLAKEKADAQKATQGPAL